MYNGMMMDPEVMRIAQEQMSKMSPQEMASIQQQMFSNPELMKLASESMRTMKPEDIKMAAEQLKHIRPGDMAEMGRKISKASPEEIAAMHAHAEAQASYELNAAQMLKQQGNDLHSRGKFHDAAEKYLHAKNTLKAMPLSKCGTLRTQCSLNLMSCYLKMGKFSECIEEGSQVLAYDPMNVKALYRRGQAYKEIGKLEAALTDLKKAHESSPDDQTVADVWRDVRDKFMQAGGDPKRSGGVIIEEMVEDDHQPRTSGGSSSSMEYVSHPPGLGSNPSTSSTLENGYGGTEAEYLKKLKDDPQSIRLFQEYVATANPEAMAAFGASGMPPEMIKTATSMIKSMKPDELQRMLEVASSMNMADPINSMMAMENGNDRSGRGSQFPEITPEMLNMATEKLSKMSPEEIQKMVEAASSLNVNSSSYNSGTSDMRNKSSGMASQNSKKESPDDENCHIENDFASLPDSSDTPSSSGIPPPTAELQETMRNSMRDPAMRQMFSSMLKSMSPEMMANMSGQFGFKFTKEEAAKAQQAMASLSSDDLERMMRWAERAQKPTTKQRSATTGVLDLPRLPMATAALSTAASPSQLCTGRHGRLSPSRGLLCRPPRGLGLAPKGRGGRVTCMATSIAAEDVPDMGKRQLLNLLLLGAVSLPVTAMVVPYVAFLVPPSSGGSGGGVVAKDALGNDVFADKWLKNHGPGDRTLVQGLKGDPTYLVVEMDKTLATYGINAVCTHLGCVVPWNSAENKFICPCHGSQYNNQGKVVRGPAPLSLALAHADIDEGKVVLVPWVETDFRTGEDPWWS